MRTPASILVVTDHGEGIADCLGKVLGLAREYGARIELFLCEAEQAYELAHQYDREGVEKARAECVSAALAYLSDLRAALDPQGVEVSVAAACESPLYAGIVQRVLRSEPDLVIKRTDVGTSGHSSVPDPNDWQLMCTCPTTLMLVRGRSWHVPARFAAAVDVSESETAGLSEHVLDAASVLAGGWRAELDVIYGETATAAPAQGHIHKLRRLCEARQIPSDHTHVLQGDPVRTLPAFVARKNYDVLVVGALAHRRSPQQPGSLTSKFVDALGCDFVLVKPPGFRTPVGPVTARV